MTLDKKKKASLHAQRACNEASIENKGSLVKYPLSNFKKKLIYRKKKFGSFFNF